MKSIIIRLIPILLLVITSLWLEIRWVYSSAFASAILSNNIVNTESSYEIMFTTGTSGPVSAIAIKFPTGTNLANARIIESSGVGIGALYVSTNTQLTYTLLSPVRVAVGTPIRLEIGGIRNANTPGSLTLVIDTKNRVGEIIDGPTPTVINLKQSLEGDISNGAVTSSKIADGALTGSKIAGTTKLLFANCMTNITIPAHRTTGFYCAIPGASEGDQVMATYSGLHADAGWSGTPVYGAIAESGKVGILVTNFRDVPKSLVNEDFSVIVFKAITP